MALEAGRAVGDINLSHGVFTLRRRRGLTRIGILVMRIEFWVWFVYLDVKL